jgi:tetratricopeptide (TPR) repeat protein
MWLFDTSERQIFLKLPLDAFGGNTASRALAFAQVHALTGDRTQLLQTSTEAEQAFAAQLKDTPDDAQLHVLRGLALAYLGREDEALTEGERGAALLPVSQDAYTGAYIQHQLVRIYTIAGERDKAVDTLERLLAVPYYVSPGWLAVDPNFWPLKGHPRFEQMLRATP